MEKIRRKHEMDSAQVHKTEMEITKTDVKKKKQMPVQAVNVYHCCQVEGLEAMTQSVLDHHRWHIPEPLSKSSLILEMSYDKSRAGTVGSESLGITEHHHGKYGSLIYELAPGKVAESYHNYRELAKNWGIQECTNSLLRFPTMIFLASVVKDKDGDIVSSVISPCVMHLNDKAQRMVDKDLNEELNDIDSPPLTKLAIDKDDIQQLLQEPEANRSLTAQFWQEINSILHPESYYAVQLPDGLAPPKVVSDHSGITYHQLCQTATKMLMQAKGSQFDCSDSSSEEADSDNEGSVDIVEEYNNNDNNNNNNRNREPGIPISSSSDEQRGEANANDVNMNNDNANEESDDNANDDDEYKHQLYPLTDYNWNGNTPLSRMIHSDWLWQCQHVKSSRVQGNMLYVLSYAAILFNQSNKHLPTMGAKSSIMPQSSLLFDDKHGYQYFWLDNSVVAQGNDSEHVGYYLFGLCDGNEMFGLLQCYMGERQLTGAENDPNIDNRKFIIQQRRSLRQNLHINGMDWAWNNSNKYSKNHYQPVTISLENDMNVLNQIIETHNERHSDDFYGMKRELIWGRFEMDGYMQLDNKAKNMCSGISTSACRNPCSTCLASRRDIYSWPTPATMSFESRTTADTVERVALKPDDANHNMGCQTVPIYTVPVHRQGPTTMHDWQGAICVMIIAYQDYIRSQTNDGQQLDADIEELSSIQNVYVEINHHQDLKDNVSKTNSADAEERVNQNNIKLRQLKREYEFKLNAWKLRMETNNANNYLCKFLKIMQKYHINLHYCMSGSIQGKMCARICEARWELIALAKEIDYSCGVLWEHLFINMNYVYLMTKRKHKKLYNTVELASLKYAYINMYHQTLMVVCLWKRKGKSGMKLHYLMHDIEHCFKDLMSTGHKDDERFENVNQHVLAAFLLYQGWNG
ncbi:MAG: hypothetical protein ACPG2Y_01210, partial [Acholeplasmataceae bacterium]